MKKALLTAIFIAIGILFSQVVRTLVFPSEERQQQLQSNTYPEAFKKSFMLSCTQEGTREQCECAVNFYQTNFKYGDYINLIKSSAHEQAIQEMQQICL